MPISAIYPKKVRVPEGWMQFHRALDEVCLRLHGESWRTNRHHGQIAFVLKKKGDRWKRTFSKLYPVRNGYKRKPISLPIPGDPTLLKQSRAFRLMVDDGGTQMRELLSSGSLIVQLRSRRGHVVETGIPKGVWFTQWSVLLETDHVQIEQQDEPRYMRVLVNKASLEKAIQGLGVDHSLPVGNAGVSERDIERIKTIIGALQKQFEAGGVQASREEWQDISRTIAQRVCGSRLTVAKYKAIIRPHLSAAGGLMKRGKKADPSVRAAKVSAIRYHFLRTQLASFKVV